jgi:hypothetical protein
MQFEDLTQYKPTANINIRREDTGEVLFSGHNVMTNTVKWLFARLLANANPTDPNPPYPQGHEPAYGIWGLALGSGSPTWPAETQPQETPVQTALVQEFARKKLSRINYVIPDATGTSFNPVNTLSTYVDFEVVVNATTDNITQSIREMGLIGGGTVKTTNPATYTSMGNTTTNYFVPDMTQYSTVAEAEDTIVLVNYKTLPPLLLPPGINVIFSWVISF